MKIYGSKKATVTIGGVAVIPVILVIVTYLLVQAGASQELTESIVQVLGWALGILLAGYNVGQGIADVNKPVDLSQFLPPPIESKAE